MFRPSACLRCTKLVKRFCTHYDLSAIQFANQRIHADVPCAYRWNTRQVWVGGISSGMHQCLGVVDYEPPLFDTPAEPGDKCSPDAVPSVTGADVGAGYLPSSGPAPAVGLDSKMKQLPLVGGQFDDRQEVGRREVGCRADPEVLHAIAPADCTGKGSDAAESGGW